MFGSASSPARPRFVYQLRPNQSISERGLVLVRMDQKADHREIRVAKVGSWTTNTRTGFDQKKLIPIAVTRKGETLEIVPDADLGAAESFVPRGLAPSASTSESQGGKHSLFFRTTYFCFVWVAPSSASRIRRTPSRPGRPDGQHALKSVRTSRNTILEGRDSSECPDVSSRPPRSLGDTFRVVYCPAFRFVHSVRSSLWTAGIMNRHFSEPNGVCALRGPPAAVEEFLPVQEDAGVATALAHSSLIRSSNRRAISGPGEKGKNPTARRDCSIPRMLYSFGDQRKEPLLKSRSSGCPRELPMITVNNFGTFWIV